MLNEWNHQRAGAYLLELAAKQQIFAKNTNEFQAALVLVERWQEGKYYAEMQFREVLVEFGLLQYEIDLVINTKGLKNG